MEGRTKIETNEQKPQSLTREGAWSRLLGVVVSPRATFESIGRKPSWLLPVLLIVFVNVAATYSQQRRGGLLTAPQRVGLEQQLKSSPALSHMTQQQRGQKLHETRSLDNRVITGAAYFGVLLGTPLVVLIIAAVLLGAFNLVFRAGVKYGQSLAVTSYALIPFLVNSLISLALIWVRPPGTVPAQSMFVASLAPFLPSHAPLWLVGLARSLNAFDLWTLGLLAVGYAAVSLKKVQFGKALALVLSLWGVYLFAMVGLSVAAARP
ncbi:MAG: YIP1 family protein [Candidatus Acidiferrales bacterium]